MSPITGPDDNRRDGREALEPVERGRMIDVDVEKSCLKDVPLAFAHIPQLAWSQGR
jgi:hypothetical protein